MIDTAHVAPPAAVDPSAMAPLHVQASRRPDKLALIDANGRQRTYREFNQRACRVANALLALGVRPGDKIAALLHNGFEFLEVHAACAKLRATFVAINYRLKPLEIDYIVRDAEAVALIVGSDPLESVRPLYQADHPDRALIQADWRPLPSPLARRIIVAPIAGAETASPPAISGELAYETLLAAAPATEPSIEGGEVGGAMTYTSGTTGRPKGVYRAPGRTPPASRLQVFALLRLGAHNVHLVCCPLYHAAPIFMASTTLAFGGTVVVMPRFEPEQFLHMVQTHRISTTAVVPTVLNRILNLPDVVKQRYDVSSLRSMVSAGALFPYPLKRRVVEYFGDDCLFEYYGSTEAGFNTVLLPADQLRKPGSCGRVAPGTHIRLLDEAGDEVPIGQPGEMFIRNESMFDGYYNNPTATQRIQRDGYVSVGDVAYCDDEGFYYVVDRRVDMVISGGVNIYPAEIEAVLITHPNVYDVAVVGAPHPDWGETLRAYVALRDGPPADPTATEAGLIAFCRARLADYKTPRAFVFVDELPYSPSGKLLKRELRDRALAELGLKPGTIPVG